ncbi:MAG: molecular chaperone HscC [Hungatella sp.]|jgi:molecular chaperone HscC|nr:molecular chaperone HscC [Hungatella sp.]MCI9501119.1 molecular chaperone HscC [Hungatella sp.]
MIIGIDLGTTNSLVAYFTEEGPKIIPNRLGKNLTPSVVSIDEEKQVYVGELAAERMLLYPDSAASVFKRDMGSKREFKLLDQTFLAEELSSLVLRALKEDAETYLGETVEEAVISVPAYFDDARRRATKRAGELAGLKVERIISEPTAAAIAYGLYQSQAQARFLVFDLGGGTFDVSILELYDTILEVRAVAGDNFLGGEDFTAVLENLFFEKHYKLDRLSLDEKTLRHIHKQAELCKLGFGDRRVSKMSCKVGDELLELEVDLPKYEEACGELLERIRRPVKRSLADAHIRLSDIDKVVLVGGATKSPVVRRFVSKLFKMIPDTNINPDEAVALGAAIQGAMKERKEAIKEVILTDVCPFTLGTEVVREWENNQYEGGVFCPIIDRNTVIPASRTERLYTVRDNQDKIRINVLQGESRFAANNLSLGELLIDIPQGKAGQESVDVTYTYDINSILEVEVKVISTGEVEKKVFLGRDVDMTPEEIEERLKTLSYLKIHPRDREENKYLLLRGERVYEESLGDDRLFVERAIRKFEKALDTYDQGLIEEAKEEFKRFLEMMEE